MKRLRYVRMSTKKRGLIWLCTIVLLLVIPIGIAVGHMKPILTSLATARVSNTVSRIVVAAVDEAIAEGKLEYTTLITFEKDKDGHITALKSDMAAFNRLQSQIADSILLRLGQVSDEDLAIPIGTLTGSPLLAGRGPSIRVKMQSVGSASAKFRNTFSSAGINQTRHQILLAVDVDVSILLPMFRTSTRVSNEISVGETVIVGSVPQTFTSFDTTPEEQEEYAEDYVLN